MEFGLLSGREDGKHTGVGSVEIYRIYATQAELSCRMGPIGAVNGFWLNS